MANKKWKGIRINHVMFEGDIIENPVFNQGYAFMTLRTIILENGPNGQLMEVDVDVPLMVEPNGPIAVVQGHVQQDRHLLAWGVYKNWRNPAGAIEHAFVVKKIDLGTKPYVPNEGGNPPPLP